MNGLATSAQVSELHARLDGVDARIDSMSSQINARFDRLENRFNARLSDITRVGIGIIIALLLSVVGLIVAGITQ